MAYHYSQAGQTEQAADYSLKAGDRARGLYAYVEARQHYAQALDALAGLPDTEVNRRRRVDTLLAQTVCSWRADSPQRNLDRLAEAEQLAQELSGPDGTSSGDRLRLARVHFWMGRVHYVRGAYRECIRYSEQVLSVAQESGDAELIAASSSAIGQAMSVQGRWGEAEVLLSQAIPLLKQAGNWSEWARALGYHGGVLAMMGDYAGGLAEIHRARAQAQEMNALSEMNFNNIMLVVAYIAGGDLPRAIEVTRQQVEMAAQSGDQVYLYLGRFYQSWAADRAGQYEIAAAYATKAQARLQELGGQLWQIDWLAAFTAEIAFGAGRVQEAIVLSERAVGIAQEMGGIFAEGLARRAWGQALAAHLPPEWDEAEAQLAQSLHLLELGQCRLEAARTHVAWGTLCRDRGDLAAAREHWGQAAAQWESSGLTHELERTRTLIDSL